jgi:hypothetical protein
MAHRVGVCRTCRTKFQIPASFAPKQAKCRNCGGVVEIGPMEGAPEPVQAPAPAPAAAPPPPRAPLPAPAPPPAKPEPVAAAPIRPEPARKSGVVRALLVAGIAAVLAIGLWTLLA